MKFSVMSPAGAEAWAQAIEPTLDQLMGDKPLGVEVPSNSALIPMPKLENDSYDWYPRHADVLRIKRDQIWGQVLSPLLAGRLANWRFALARVSEADP